MITWKWCGNMWRRFIIYLIILCGDGLYGFINLQTDYCLSVVGVEINGQNKYPLGYVVDISSLCQKLSTTDILVRISVQKVKENHNGWKHP